MSGASILEWGTNISAWGMGKATHGSRAQNQECDLRQKRYDWMSFVMAPSLCLIMGSKSKRGHRTVSVLAQNQGWLDVKYKSESLVRPQPSGESSSPFLSTSTPDI